MLVEVIDDSDRREHDDEDAGVLMDLEHDAMAVLPLDDIIVECVYVVRGEAAST